MAFKSLSKRNGDYFLAGKPVRSGDAIFVNFEDADNPGVRKAIAHIIGGKLHLLIRAPKGIGMKYSTDPADGGEGSR